MFPQHVTTQHPERQIECLKKFSSLIKTETVTYSERVHYLHHVLFVRRRRRRRRNGSYSL